MFKSYAQVMQFLDKLGPFKMDLGLERMENALNVLNLQKLPCPVVQIVGTNGKGSTASFLDSIARAHSLRCGLFTSPHFISVRECILYQGKQLSESQWLNFANDILAHKFELTHFEFITVFAVYAFVQCKVDLIILEAGLGGALDATSAISKDILCISSIGVDHENTLGSNINIIARQKALAMQPNINVYCAPQSKNIIEILQAVAKEKNANLNIANQTLPPSTHLGLKGKHQAHNASLALRAWDDVALRLNCTYNEHRIKRGLKQAFIAGRWQYIQTKEKSLPSKVLLDGAHNVQGFDALISSLADTIPKPALIIFSCLADKNIEALVPKILKLHDVCNKCPLVMVGLQNNERALSLTALMDLKLRLDPTAQRDINVLDSIDLALDFARTKLSRDDIEPVLICGSLYLLGEFFAMYPHYLRP